MSASSPEERIRAALNAGAATVNIGPGPGTVLGVPLAGTPPETPRAIDIPVRIKRGGEWRHLYVTELTPDELQELLEPKSQAELVRWCRMLATMVRAARAEPEGT